MSWPRIMSAVLLLAFVDSARILGVFPIPSISHQFVFRALTMELARRGHELVVVTPDPALPKNRPPDNITEIDVSFSYKTLKEIFNAFLYKRGIIKVIDLQNMLMTMKKLAGMYVEQLQHPEIKQIIADKSQKFDLIILETLLNYHLILSEIFKAPTILVSTLSGLPEVYDIVGAVARHPMLYPNIFRTKFTNLTLFEKIDQTILEYKYMKTFEDIEVYENQLLKENFGPNTPTVAELKGNVDFLLITTLQIFGDNRPVPPNVAYVGPLHLQPLKELPQNLKTYLDNSRTGVIYVSLGTNVIPSQMDEGLLNSFLDAFEALPYDILWKFDGDNLKRVPKNLKLQKWFPQRDLLAHPNIKLFVTQGGLQSTDEAIDAGVPMISIPMLADQFFNAHKHEQVGIGIKLDPFTLDAKTLLVGIQKVLNDESYRINIRKLKQIINDQPLGPMERAVWWTEYVIRHGGARHLRSPAANISWAEYLMADVIIALALILLALLLAVLLLVQLIFNTFRTKPAPKLKRCIFSDNRPVPPNVAFVGPLHLQPLKELPQDLKTYLDNSRTGVIYVSLGTNVLPSQMDEGLLNSFLDAFEALPYDILWKFDGDNLKRVPKNLKLQKWFPQRDLLAHPNIKLFVTQGGLQSTDEAIDAGVPMISIPMMADQFFNAHKHEQVGIGIKLDPFTLNVKTLLEGIQKVLNDESYRINIRKLKQIINDQPLGPMDRAVWWTEYVIRHGGARHLRSPAANISWAEYLMADVVIALALILLALLLAVLLLVQLIFNTFRTKPAPKLKRC